MTGTRVRHRQTGQAIVFAAIAMVAVVGGVAIAIDGGIFFVVQRQLQTAADAGALAGAWHDPVCPIASGAPANGCLGPPDSAATVAQNVAQANADTVRQLCGGVVNVQLPVAGTKVVYSKSVNTIVVSVDCNAPYSFGRILNLITPKNIVASAEAAIGNRDADGDMTNFTTNPDCTVTNPDKCRIARLID